MTMLMTIGDFFELFYKHHERRGNQVSATNDKYISYASLIKVNAYLNGTGNTESLHAGIYH